MKRTGTTKTMRGAVLIAALFVLPVLFVAASLLFGRYPLPVRDVLTAIIRPGSVPLATKVAVWQLRLPRALAAAFVGASLAVSGAAFQSVFRNPLVNSGILGVSNGAGFGACVAIVCFGGGVWTYLLSFVFALAAVVIYDAMGVRRETGKQGEVLNQILSQVLVEGKPITEKQLKELVGHTPLEVIGGVIVGSLVTLFFI